MRVMSRRALLKASAAAWAAQITVGPAPSAVAVEHEDAAARFRELEEKYGARLGAYGRNTVTGRVVAYRAGERFAMCSTFKTIAAAAILRDHSRCAPLTTRVVYPPADVLANSPATKANLGTGMTLGELCAAAIQLSDNTAGNLLLRQIGGPAGLSKFLRSIGDNVTRLDRWETELNTAIPGDLRDTTTPQALATSYQHLALGPVLPAPARRQLVDWLKGNTTSGERFRAGLPSGWVVADKTGTGDYAAANDVGIAWTGRGTPLALAVLTSKTQKTAMVDNALIADAARLLARALAPGE